MRLRPHPRHSPRRHPRPHPAAPDPARPGAHSRLRPAASALQQRRCRCSRRSRCMLCRSVRDPRGADMKSHTVYRTFNTDERREFVRITDDVEHAVDEAGIAEGMALVSAMHITAAVWINDDEPGIQADPLEWLPNPPPPRAA